MPTTYAHYKFGQHVRDMLPPECQKTVDAHPDLYYLGVHGPDLLFYYYLTIPIGVLVHHRSGEDFFRYAAKRIAKDNYDEEELAYIYGYLTHFALDRRCHPYITGIDSRGKFRHFQIESEFDRYLEMLDGFDPLRHKVTAHIHPTVKRAAVISKFYPGLILRNLVVSLVCSKFVLDLFVMPQRWKRVIFRLVLNTMTLFNKDAYNKNIGLVMSRKPHPQSAVTNPMLTKMEEEARADAVKFISDFIPVSKGEKEPDERFRENFNGVIPTKTK